MDALKLLTEDHLSFEALFRRYRAAASPRLREDLARRLVHEAKLHIALEEKYVYPIARERSGAVLDEHVQTKQRLAELAQLPYDDRHFDEKLATFVDELLEHSQKEERLFFPPLRKAMGRAELEALGRVIQNAREERPPDLIPEGLVARAVGHVLTAWKTQLTQSFERAYSSVLGGSAPSPRPENP
jgi:hemerythrin superfamily protein